MDTNFLKPFRNELKEISQALNKSNPPYKYITDHFQIKIGYQLFPSQSFNFWKVVLRCHGYFRKFYRHPRICIALLDSCCDSFVDINECLIFFTYFYPKLAIDLIQIRSFFNESSVSQRQSINGICQYEAQSVCESLRKHKPRHCIAIIGITANELYFDGSKFVLGQSFFAIGSSVVCLGKRAETVPANRAVLTERLMKCVIHEAAHLFGLQHCSMFLCLMNESRSIAEAAQQPFGVCPICLSKLQFLLRFDVGVRYECLLLYVGGAVVGADGGGGGSGMGHYGQFLQGILGCAAVNV